MDIKSNEFKALERAVTQQITLKRYYNEHIVGLKQGIEEITEGQTESICPFHDETRPSFHYWHSTDTCYCFGCNVGGGLVQIYRQVQYHYKNRRIDNGVAIAELIRLYDLESDSVIRELYRVAQADNTHQQSKFAEYRRKAFDLSAISVDDDVFTLDRFKQLNQRLITDMHMTEESRFRNYAQLDLQAAAALMLVKKK